MNQGPPTTTLDSLVAKMGKVSLEDNVKISALSEAARMARNKIPATRTGLLSGLRVALGMKPTFNLLYTLLNALAKLPANPNDQENGTDIALSLEELSLIIKLTIDRNVKPERSVEILRTIAALYFEDIRLKPSILCMILSRLLNDNHHNEDLICKILERKSASLIYSHLIGLFHRAVEIGNVKIVGSILDKIAYIDHESKAIAQGIHLAIDCDQNDVLLLLLDPERSPYAAAENAFIEAAGLGLRKIVLTLINVHICQYKSIIRRALEAAVQNGHIEVAEDLSSLRGDAISEAESEVLEIVLDKSKVITPGYDSKAAQERLRPNPEPPPPLQASASTAKSRIKAWFNRTK